MVDAIDEFFAELARRKFDPSVETVTGTISFDIQGEGEPGAWFVQIERGAIALSQEPREADAVAHTNRDQLDKIVTGRDSAVAAMLRGAVTVDGDLRLLFQFQRLLPAPPGARDPRERPPSDEKERVTGRG